MHTFKSFMNIHKLSCIFIKFMHIHDFMHIYRFLCIFINFHAYFKISCIFIKFMHNCSCIFINSIINRFLCIFIKFHENLRVYLISCIFMLSCIFTIYSASLSFILKNCMHNHAYRISCIFIKFQAYLSIFIFMLSCISFQKCTINLIHTWQKRTSYKKETSFFIISIGLFKIV